MTVHSIVRLTEQHRVREFDCGVPELNHWLQAVARQHQDKLLSKTYVLTESSEPEVLLGYYALALRGLMAKESLPPALVKRLPGRIPGFTLARLGVAVAAQGLGFGEYLVLDAMRRAKVLSEQVGGVALFVDAKDDRAAQFYARFDFVPLPSDHLTLMIPLATI